MDLARDHASLCNLYASYCHSIDTHERSAIEACFTLEAVLHVVDDRLPDRAAGTEAIVGRGAIVDRMMRVSTSRSGFVHETTNVVVVPGAARYEGRASFRVLTQTCRPESMGHYEDVVVATPAGGWAFARRAVVYHWRDSW
jgi:hypothetical protein